MRISFQLLSFVNTNHMRYFLVQLLLNPRVLGKIEENPHAVEATGVKACQKGQHVRHTSFFRSSRGQKSTSIKGNSFFQFFDSFRL